MAWIEKRGATYRVGFRYQNAKLVYALGNVSAADAEAAKTSTEELLRLLKRNVITLPNGISIEEFLYFRGNPPSHPAKVATITLQQLRDLYFAASQGKLEQTTLDGISLHFNHMIRLLKAETPIVSITRADLQEYVDRRAKEWIDPNRYRRIRREKDAKLKPRSNRKPAPLVSEDKPKRHPSSATIRKEIISLRTSWNWARRQLGIVEEFPGSGLGFAKIEEALPFLTWDAAQRRVEAGDDPDKVWDCVYLRTQEIAELLAWVKSRPLSPWVYPMFCFVAHTGVRRSEMIRVQPSDVDLRNGMITIREKKRDKRKLTTRRVPMTPFLADVMTKWFDERAAGKLLFCKSNGSDITPREAQNYFHRAVLNSQWSVLRGWHVFRHSFISALASKGIDQRVIDDMVGHSTEEQRRRYRHLYPDVSKHALESVFG